MLLVWVVTIAADLEGGAAALGLLLRADWRWFVVPLAAVLVALMVIGRYDELQNVLRYVLIGFIAYAVSAFLAHPTGARSCTRPSCHGPTGPPTGRAARWR
ncbi:MAG TPA: hypothetical protein VMU14_24055 [Acidimicrobiales bacterium]|nr:hypothetical protein [Acidimicrobiales bacterium]